MDNRIITVSQILHLSLELCVCTDIRLTLHTQFSSPAFLLAGSSGGVTEVTKEVQLTQYNLIQTELSQPASHLIAPAAAHPKPTHPPCPVSSVPLECWAQIPVGSDLGPSFSKDSVCAAIPNDMEEESLDQCSLSI